MRRDFSSSGVVVRAALLLAFSFFFGIEAKAAATITIQESGADVVATVSGAFNVGGCSNISGTVSGRVRGNGALVWVGTGAVRGCSTGWSGPGTIGSGGSVINANSSSGDIAGISTSYVVVPSAYVDNAALSGTSTWNNQTIASLGLTAGTYVYTLAGTGDTITVQIGGGGGSPTPVPTLSEWALILFGTLMAGALIWYQHRRV